MTNWILKLALPKLGPMIGRYIAGAVIGLLIASLQHFKITLDPATVSDLTTGLTGLFIAIVMAAGYAKLQDQKHAETGKVITAVARDAGVPINDVIAAAVAQAAVLNNSVQTEPLAPIAGVKTE